MSVRFVTAWFSVAPWALSSCQQKLSTPSVRLDGLYDALLSACADHVGAFAGLDRADPRDLFDPETFRYEETVKRSAKALQVRKKNQGVRKKAASLARQLQQERVAYQSAASTDADVQAAAKKPAVPPPPQATVVETPEDRAHSLKSRDKFQHTINLVLSEHPVSQKALKTVRDCKVRISTTSS